jgi:hypothetical protein
VSLGQGGREGGREGRREGGREGGREDLPIQPIETALTQVDEEVDVV